jgi:glycerophosphoryl diester phosphodiesterase
LPTRWRAAADGAELDVQLTRDGVVVVHHDFRLKAGLARKDGVWLAEPGPRIKDLSLEELRQFDVGTAKAGSAYARTHPLLKPASAPIPTLQEVLALSRRFLLLVELKCDTSADSSDPIALADAAYAVTGSQAIYVGFDWRALARIRSASAVPAGSPRTNCRVMRGRSSTASRRLAGRAGFPTSPTPRRTMSPMRARAA